MPTRKEGFRARRNPTHTHTHTRHDMSCCLARTLDGGNVGDGVGEVLCDQVGLLARVQLAQVLPHQARNLDNVRQRHLRAGETHTGLTPDTKSGKPRPSVLDVSSHTLPAVELLVGSDKPKHTEPVLGVNPVLGRRHRRLLLGLILNPIQEGC